MLAGCGSPGPGAEEGNETEVVGTETDAGIGGTETGTETDGLVTETDGTATETDEAGTETGTETDGAGTETTAGALDLDETIGETPEGIEVSNTELSRSGGNARVTGVIENTGDQTFEEVETQVTLLDDNDELIGQFFHDTEEAEVSSLEPGGTWEFAVEFPEEDLEDATGYRIDVDTDIDQNVDFQLGTETTNSG